MLKYLFKQGNVETLLTDHDTGYLLDYVSNIITAKTFCIILKPYTE